MSTSHTSKSPVVVEQANADKLSVNVDNFPPQDHFQNTPHYQTLPDGVRTAVWIPVASYKIHLVSFVVSTPAGGYIILYDRTLPAVDVEIMRLDFNARLSMLFGLNTDLDLDWNHVLVAEWTQDAPGGGTAYVTAIGHEHNPANWPP